MCRNGSCDVAVAVLPPTFLGHLALAASFPDYWRRAVMSLPRFLHGNRYLPALKGRWTAGCAGRANRHTMEQSFGELIIFHHAACVVQELPSASRTSVTSIFFLNECFSPFRAIPEPTQLNETNNNYYLLSIFIDFTKAWHSKTRYFTAKIKNIMGYEVLGLVLGFKMIYLIEHNL